MKTNPKSFAQISLGVLAFAVAGTAQITYQPVPGHVDLAEGNHWHTLPFGVPGFRTQFVIERAAVAATGAVLTGIQFRADINMMADLPTVIPNVTVRVAPTQQTLAGVSDVFANNVTTPPTIVFQGSVTLPDYLAPGLESRDWSIHLPFQDSYFYDGSLGNLLVEIVGDNTNPPWAAPNYLLDACEPGGSAHFVGQSGPLGVFDGLMLSVGGIGLPVVDLVPPSELSIGYSIEFNTEMLFSQPPGLLGLSLAPTPAPIDLTPDGAPDNWLRIVPEALIPLSWTSTVYASQVATVTLTVPTDPLLVGVVVLGQSAILEPTANPLGIVLTNAVRLCIGDSQAQIPVRQIDAIGPNATSGTLLELSFDNAPPVPGSVAFRLEGVFF